MLARQVTHPNVVRIHDLGEIDGIKYITMPFVNGQTLGQMLAREGRMPVARALGIFRQIVSGMRAAHQKGVVHRDLKPVNIMIEEGVAYIMDFGIARQVEGDRDDDGGRRNRARWTTWRPSRPPGSRSISARTSMHSVCILQDMIVGRSGRPKTDNPLSDLMRRLAAPPPPVRTISPDVPEPVERIITRCLQIESGSALREHGRARGGAERAR